MPRVRHFAVCLAAILAGCGTTFDPTANTGDSGILGTVLVQPDCPPQAASTTDCTNQPLSADIVIRDARNGTPVAAVTSDANGKFQTSLPPGEYEIDPQPGPSGLPFGHV